MNIEDMKQVGEAMGTVLLAGALRVVEGLVGVADRRHAEELAMREKELLVKERDVVAREALTEMLREGDLTHLMRTAVDAIIHSQDHRNDVGAGG